MPLQRLVPGIFAALLTLSFFMTWVNIDLGFFSRKVSGSALPGQLRDLLTASDAMSVAFGGASSGAGTAALIFYLLYLIPILGTLLAYRAFTGKRGRLALKGQAILTGLVSLLLAGLMGLLLSNLLGADLSSLLVGNGYGLALLTSLGLILTPLFLKREAALSLSPEQQRRVQQRGQQAVTQASGWLKDRQQQVTSRLEEGRVSKALGRRTNRDLLTRDDQVIAPRGSVITHGLVEQARQADVLDLLLGSVDNMDTPGQPETSRSTGP